MKNIIKQLQEYQLVATQTGISYNLDVVISDMSVTDVTVSMFYSTVDGETVDNRNFRTCISNNDKFTGMKLKRIENFINNVVASK